MELNNALAAMEAILFTMGDAVEISRLAEVLEMSKEDTRKAAGLLEERYEQKGSGLKLNWYDDAVQLSTRPEQYENLIRIAITPKKLALTETLLETLSIIAYRQPVTKLEIEDIRGVNSDFAVNRLLQYDLVQELGRKDAPGRPILFGTTEQFLRCFGVRNLDELPALDTVQMEEFREEAEEEVRTRLNV